MMGGTPPASTVNEALELLKVVVSDPAAAKAHLVALQMAHTGLDDRVHALNDYETKLSAREHAIAVREQAAKEQDAELLRKHDGIFLMQTELAAAKATHQTEVTKAQAALDARRKDIEAADATNRATANKHAMQRDEMASQEVALRSMRVGLEAREKLVEEGEAALAAKQDRLTKAIQGL